MGSGALFTRLNSAILQIGYDAKQVGETMYVKFLSFNVYGRALQDLADVTEYSFTLSPTGTPLFDLTATQGALATLDEVDTPQNHPERRPRTRTSIRGPWRWTDRKQHMSTVFSTDVTLTEDGFIYVDGYPRPVVHDLSGRVERPSMPD